MGKKITKEQLIAILKDNCDKDLERAHERSDDALLNYINDPDVTKAFNSVDKWYA